MKKYLDTIKIPMLIMIAISVVMQPVNYFVYRDYDPYDPNLVVVLVSFLIICISLLITLGISILVGWTAFKKYQMDLKHIALAGICFTITKQVLSVVNLLLNALFLNGYFERTLAPYEQFTNGSTPVLVVLLICGYLLGLIFAFGLDALMATLGGLIAKKTSK